jgi:hypothetical protein
VAKNPAVTQPTDQGVGPPPSRPADIVLVEIAKIQSDGEYLKRDMGEVRSHILDLRDRVTKLEVKVDHLPSKGFIVVVVTTILVIVNGVALLAPKIISLLAVAK